MKKVLLIATGFLFFFHGVFAQGIWTRKADFAGTYRQSAVGFSIGGKGYFGTGASQENSSNSNKEFWEYDTLTDTWTQKADFGGAARYGAAGFSIGTKGYIGTGGIHISYNHFNDFWEWDQATNIWVKKADLGFRPIFSVSFSIGNKGYIGTGLDSIVGQTKRFWEWDQASDTWTQKADFGGVARDRAAGFSIGTKGYIGTGLNSTTYLDDFWEWDQATNIWTQKANVPGGLRDRAVGFSIGSKGYIGTGLSPNSGYYKDFWEYDPAVNLWTKKADFGGSARYSSSGFSIGNKGYLGVGTVVPPDFWEFSPDSVSVGMHGFSLNENFFTIYPNPTTGSINISLNENIRDGEVRVFNMTGREVYASAPSHAEHSRSVTEATTTLSLNIPIAGIYFVKVSTVERQYIQKIIVE